MPTVSTTLEFKPDLSDAARRWAAYLAGGMVDRPLVLIAAPRQGFTWDTLPPENTYRDRFMGDIDQVLDRTLTRAAAIWYGGEMMPAFRPSLATDEVAAVCGAHIEWSQESGDTNWSEPCVSDWDAALPLQIKTDSPAWQRLMKLLERAAQRLEGRMLIEHLDLHTNMDLLMAMRGSQRLCMDLIDQPEAIDRAMTSARAVFRPLWDAVAQAAKMKERGYCHWMYSREPAGILQCDFSCMIGGDMFRRWVMPALEEETAVVKHALYHWDGPDAVQHADDLLSIKGLHTLSYVPGAGHGGSMDYIDLYQRVQAAGKAVQLWASPDQIKVLHRKLRPEKTMYFTTTPTQAKGEELLDWLVKNT